MSPHLHVQLPSLSNLHVVVQIPADSAPGTARMVEEGTEEEDCGLPQSSQSPAGEKEPTRDQWKNVIQRRNILCGIRMNNQSGPDVSGVPLVYIHNEVSLSWIDQNLA
jgi:hypothetical protein